MTRHLPYDRTERIADEVYRVLAQAMIADLSDPRLAGVTITRVRLTKDLRTATVYFHLKGATDATRAAALKGLMRAAGFFKRRIGEAIPLKCMPEIRYYYDERIDLEERMEELFERCRKT